MDPPEQHPRNHMEVMENFDFQPEEDSCQVHINLCILFILYIVYISVYITYEGIRNNIQYFNLFRATVSIILIHDRVTKFNFPDSSYLKPRNYVIYFPYLFQTIMLGFHYSRNV